MALGKIGIVEEFTKEKDEKNPLTCLLKLRDKIDRHPMILPALKGELTNELEAIVEFMIGPTLAEDLIGGNK